MFGKMQRGASERPNKPKKPLIPKWLGMLVLILMVMSCAVALTLWKPWAPVQPQRNEVPAGHDQEETNKDYRFYDLLPEQQITPIPEQAIPEIKNKDAVVIIEAPPTPTTEEATPTDSTGTLTTSDTPPVPTTSYLLQIRSYPDPDSADARRAEIILNGLSADVVQVTEGGQTWYRVVSGPYDSQESAILAQQTLQHSGIDSIVVKR